MNMLGGVPWRPTVVERVLGARDTSTGVAQVVTDAGEAYIKTLGNPEGPAALIREFLGTSLAQWFGLPTFEFALMSVTGTPPIPLGRGAVAVPGTAFVTRAHKGEVWSGASEDLGAIENPEAITRLVVLDTWLRNPDRFPPPGIDRRPNHDNVFFSEEGASPGRYRLVAMDFTLCFHGESDLTTRVAHIDRIKDDRIFGLFPGFVPYLRRDVLNEAIERLRTDMAWEAMGFLRAVPSDWELPSEVREALLRFILQRATHVADNIEGWLAVHFGAL